MRYDDDFDDRRPHAKEPSTKELVKAVPLKVKVIGACIVLLLLLFVLNPFVVVGPGHRGVLVTLGAVSQNVFGEGLHLKLPLFQRVIKMDVQVQKTDTDAAGASKDLQDVHMTIATNYHVVPESTPWVYQKIGVDYTNRILAPAIQEVVKAVAAKYTAVDLITQREKVRMEMKDLLRTRMTSYAINIDDFAITNFKFSKEFTAAIEGKQKAEQLALTAQRDLERVKFEAEQKVAQAKAEAEALRLQKENITPQLIELRKIEASMKAITKWDGHMPQITGGALPFIDFTGRTFSKEK